jgi:hypothetical protein
MFRIIYVSYVQGDRGVNMGVAKSAAETSRVSEAMPRPTRLLED